jgi:iodotyrosine deiodinase
MRNMNWTRVPAAARLKGMRVHSHPFEPYGPPRLGVPEALRRGRELLASLEERRSVRWFSPEPVPVEAIEIAVRVANTAPSGAHEQPWTFVATRDTGLKRRIREAAEQEERRFYRDREAPAWHAALARLETDEHKEFLETAPWLVAVFAQKSTTGPDGSRRKNYYVSESVGIACGLFITALHTMGLATLTHTPNPMTFLGEVLGRPATERAYILFPVGYPADDCEVPVLSRKPLSEALVLAPGVSVGRQAGGDPHRVDGQQGRADPGDHRDPAAVVDDGLPDEEHGRDQHQDQHEDRATAGDRAVPPAGKE